MSAPHDHTSRRSLREWWAAPPRSGLQRMINPWEYRHLRAFGLVRMVGGGIAATAAAICLAYGVFGWAAFFGAIAGLNFAGGIWYIGVANSQPAHT